MQKKANLLEKRLKPTFIMLIITLVIWGISLILKLVLTHNEIEIFIVDIVNLIVWGCAAATAYMFLRTMSKPLNVEPDKPKTDDDGPTEAQKHGVKKKKKKK